MKIYEYKIEEIWMRGTENYNTLVENTINKLSEDDWRVVSMFWLYRRDMAAGERLMVLLERLV